MTTRWARGSTGARASPRAAAVRSIERSMTSSSTVPRARRRVARSARSRAAASTTRAPSGDPGQLRPARGDRHRPEPVAVDEQAEQPRVGLLQQRPERGDGDRALLGVLLVASRTARGHAVPRLARHRARRIRTPRAAAGRWRRRPRRAAGGRPPSGGPARRRVTPPVGGSRWETPRHSSVASNTCAGEPLAMARSRCASRSRLVCRAVAVRESIDVCRACSAASRCAPRRSSRRTRSGRPSASCSSARANVRCSRRGKDAARRTSGRASCSRARSTCPIRAFASAASTAASAPTALARAGPSARGRQGVCGGPRVATEEQLRLEPQQRRPNRPGGLRPAGEPPLGSGRVPSGVGVLVPEQGEPGPLEVGLCDVVRDAPCARRLLALLERLEGLVDQTDLGKDTGQVEVPDGEIADRWGRLVRDLAGLRHERQRTRKVAEQHLQPPTVVDRATARSVKPCATASWCARRSRTSLSWYRPRNW